MIRCLFFFIRKDIAFVSPLDSTKITHTLNARYSSWGRQVAVVIVLFLF
jgi:hypothetical protein